MECNVLVQTAPFQFWEIITKANKFSHLLQTYSTWPWLLYTRWHILPRINMALQSIIIRVCPHIKAMGQPHKLYWCICCCIYVARCFYNMAFFHQNTRIIHLIAHLWGLGEGCPFWVQRLSYVKCQSLKCCIQYHDVMDHVLMAPDCTYHPGASVTNAKSLLAKSF